MNALDYQAAEGSSPTSEEKVDMQRVKSSGSNDQAKGANFGTVTHDSNMDNHAMEVRDEAAIESAGQGTGTSFYVWALTGVSAISGMLFGYDTGAIDAVLVQTGNDIGGQPLSTGDKQLITSALSVGAIGGAVVAGYLADKIGRKRTIVFCDVLFIVGAIVQATIHDKWPFAIGRFIMGIGVGAASMIAPVFISEVAPVRVRGRLVTLNCVAITGGQVIATAIGAGFVGISSGWRWIIALGAFPPLIQGLIIELCFPESPRHLQKIGKSEQAGKVFSKMYPHATPEQIAAKVDVLRRHIDSDQSTIFQKWKNVVTVPQIARAAFLTAWLQAAQQLSGFNALMYYSATIFSDAGLDNATATSIVVSGVNFLVTCGALVFLDRFGRRNFFKTFTPIMLGGLVFAIVVFYYMTASTDHKLVSGADYPHSLTSLMIVSMVVYVAGYAGGLGHIPWSSGDLFDQHHRGVGASIGAFVNWGFNLLVSSTFLKLLDAIKPAATFGFYLALSTIFGIGMYFLYPETLSLSLEQARSTLDGGFHVKHSEKLRKQNVRMLREQIKAAKKGDSFSPASAAPTAAEVDETAQKA